MDSLVMLRWIIPVPRPDRSPRDLVAGRIAPALRAGGWLYGPGTSHFVEDHGAEAWVTVVTGLDDSGDVRSELIDLLASEPAVETTHDPFLAPGAAWYRTALQRVTHVALEVLDAGADIPVVEYLAFERPGDAVVELADFLTGVSDTYRRACRTYARTEAFWRSFFRPAPTPELPRSGRRLWNLAG